MRTALPKFSSKIFKRKSHLVSGDKYQAKMRRQAELLQRIADLGEEMRMLETWYERVKNVYFEQSFYEILQSNTPVNKATEILCKLRKAMQEIK